MNLLESRRNYEANFSALQTRKKLKQINASKCLPSLTGLILKQTDKQSEYKQKGTLLQDLHNI